MSGKEVNRRDFLKVAALAGASLPGQAISYGEMTYEVLPMGNAGVRKWPMDGKKCFKSWVQFATDCNMCIKVCPFNKPDCWLHEITKGLIGFRSGAIDRMLLKLDDVSGYGTPSDPREFWKKRRYIRTKS
jgi:hypothetical protein